LYLLSPHLDSFSDQLCNAIHL